MVITIFILFEVATRPAISQITQENKDPELSTFPIAYNGNTENSYPKRKPFQFNIFQKLS